jgi:hypothetical protein
MPLYKGCAHYGMAVGPPKQPFARLLFSANPLPGSSDASRAFFDRWLIVPFANRSRQTRREIPRRSIRYH